MDFSHSAKSLDYQARLAEFMQSHIYPAEKAIHDRSEWGSDPVEAVPEMAGLKTEARARGLWNLFLPDEEYGAGLNNSEYAPLAEMMGRAIELAPEATNCSAPDTGNMEVLHLFGTAEQKERWLVPLLDGHIRSNFGMTEPAVASSDPRNLELSITPDGDSYIVNGRKWFSSGAMSKDSKVAIVMGVTNPDAPPKQRFSMILVPTDTEGVTTVRDVPVYGYRHRGGHAEVDYDNVRVPATNLISGPGEGYMIAQARLGPGRIHHCMRAIGQAERALSLMVDRAKSREAFGKRVADQGVIQDWIAESRLRIDQARLLVMRAAWLIDTQGNRAARVEVSAIKIVAPNVALWVIDKAVQVHGGMGVTDDTPLASMWANMRTLRIADGPDEVHKMVLARREIGRD
ncbi:MAG: acyl-CoA dehydrogenase family protein [Actinomycetota bacterium]|jgi:acyl-CoA dehydrogenase|nr:acyl-CoA dehydrogenase family protein [Actinomycetota bacterium]